MPSEEEGMWSPAPGGHMGPQEVIIDLAWGGEEAGPIGRMQESFKPSSLWGSVPDSLLSPTWTGSHETTQWGACSLTHFTDAESQGVL